MKFEFDTTTDGATEAAALATALAVLHGSRIADIMEAAATRLEVDPRVVASNTPAAPKAADGFSDVTDASEPSAADAFAPEKFSAIKDDTPMSPDNFGTMTGGAAPALDTAGIPWDARIHAGTKTTNKDGTWSRRRNTPDALFDTVMAELKGAGKEASASEAFDNPTPSEAPAPPVTAGSSTEASTTGQTAPTVASPSNITFPLLMVKITKAQMAGTIDKDKVTEILGMFGMTQAKELASADADTVAAVNAMVDDHVNG